MALAFIQDTLGVNLKYINFSESASSYSKLFSVNHLDFSIFTKKSPGLY
jgi:hypothetical protein